MPPKVDVHSRSIPGSVHPYEDRILVNESKMLYAVADGVTNSSRGSGSVAAEHAIELLEGFFSGDVVKAVKETHKQLIEMRLGDRSIGETTLTAACIREGWLEVVNVGDSPAYLAREDSLLSMFQEDKGYQGYITQVIGYPENIDVHLQRVRTRRGDYLILASDGVAHVLNSLTITPPVREGVGSNELVDQIIMAAEEQSTGYDDDKSVIVVRFLAV